ncbi:AAA family ATPase [Amycolatopsis pigmentata]|uniref:AAA family ATPase n=1 Tax=Amycolatopsis pigmentata TaxID=450801 RepID=A0ABW5FXI4_9PSEU
MTFSADTPPEWRVYHGTGWPSDPLPSLPKPPPWRRFDRDGAPEGPLAEQPSEDRSEFDRRLGTTRGNRVPHRNELAMVNAALYLRRPLLVTGRPGTGKSSLAYLIARELGLGPVLRWPITSRTSLKDGLYLYDAIGRVQDAGSREDGVPPDIGDYVHLRPLGTALLPHARPRVLLIDELDKSDIDLPNDLLNVFEDGEYEIPELVRIARRQPEVTVLTADRGGSAAITGGFVRCREFPVVIITSNGERDFPPAFLRRCLNLHIEPPTAQQLGAMVKAQFGPADRVDVARLIGEFLERSEAVGGLASDQLLNAVHLAAELATSGAYQTDEEWQDLLKAIWHPLSSAGGL